MFFSTFVLAVASLVALVAAQNGSYPYLINPNDPSISPMERNSWCVSQTNSCRQICGGYAPTNLCDGTQLTYSCTCGDGSSPNITQYNSTLPFFECQIYQQQCLAKNPTDAQAQQACNQIPCGGKSPEAAQSSASAASAASASMTMTSSSSASSTGGSSTAAAAGATSSAAKTGGSAPKIILDPYLTVGSLVAGSMLLGGLAL